MAFDRSTALLAEASARLRVEGYASLFGIEDLNGDVVQRGAFRDSIQARKDAPLPMLLDHRAEPVGEWTYIAEDSRGLFVRGSVLAETKRGIDAIRLLEQGAIDGLSIGFIARRSRPRPARGRDLLEIDLWEVSIVGVPMAPQARLRVVRNA
jgi:uncharacterized protein